MQSNGRTSPQAHGLISTTTQQRQDFIIGIYNAASLSDPTLRKEFALEGWHLPSDGEWTDLENILIADGHNYDGSTTGIFIAKAMAPITSWNSCSIIGEPGNNRS